VELILAIGIAICAVTMSWACAGVGADRQEIRQMLEREDAERADDDAFIDD